MRKEKATFAMGCFWRPQALFDGVEGVVETEVGFMGGREERENYDYKEVCSGRTGHAEVIDIQFDSSRVSYEELLQIFWDNHDPTQLNRQGPDVGKQYRSAIFHHNGKQRELAESSKGEMQAKTEGTIVTQIVEAGKFYKAGEHHQKYLKKNEGATC